MIEIGGGDKKYKFKTVYSYSLSQFPLYSGIFILL